MNSTEYPKIGLKQVDTEICKDIHRWNTADRCEKQRKAEDLCKVAIQVSSDFLEKKRPTVQGFCKIEIKETKYIVSTN